MENFKPIKGVKNIIKEKMIEGYIVKMDGGASTLMLLIPRSQYNHLEVKYKQMSNIGKHSEIEGVITLPRTNISSIIEELENAYGYSVIEEDVFSGCCQYHTWITYLASE